MLYAPSCTPFFNVNIQNGVEYLYAIAIPLMRPFLPANKLGSGGICFPFIYFVSSTMNVAYKASWKGRTIFYAYLLLNEATGQY